MSKKGKKNQLGMGLVGMLVALGILGIIAAGLARLMGNSLKAERHAQLNVDKRAITRTLFAKTDCALSYSGSTCPAGGPVELLDSDGDTLVADSNPPTRYGDWAVRADCNASNDGLVLRATRLKPGKSITSTDSNDFLEDPLTSRTPTWSSDGSLLLPAGATICPSSAASGTFLGVQAVYKGTGSSSVSVNVPSGTNVVKVTGHTNYTGGPWDEADDSIFLVAIVDLSANRTSGFQSVTEGQANYQANFRWQDSPLGSPVTNVNGDTSNDHHSTKRPSFTWNAGTNTLTLGNRWSGAPADPQASYVFEFYR